MRNEVRRRRRSGGFSLLEIMIALAVVAILFLAMMSLIYSTNRYSQMNREQTVALNAARAMVELARNQEFGKILALYNDDPADDPAGKGTAPGPHFDVPGLTVRKGDKDGKAGRIEFPTVGGELREDVTDPFLELPHDLNGDDKVDAVDHRGDYKILPVTIVVEWRGIGDESKFVYRTRFIAR